MEYKLYVGNLAYSVIEADLQALFAEAGAVKSIALIKDKFTGQPKGFAFVEMETQEGMQNAIGMLNGRQVLERAITVSAARPREDRDRAGGNNRFQNDRKRKPRGGNQKQRW